MLIKFFENLRKEEGMEKINKICKFAVEIKRRRGDAIICTKDKKEEDILFFINFPNLISTALLCVATTTFSTGHATPDAETDIDKMYTCKDRVPEEKK